LDDTGALGDEATPHPKHGTYVAGVIGSQIDGVGTNGIWPAVKVLSRRVFTGPDAGTTAMRYVKAIDWCVNQPGVDVKVINLSLSGLTSTATETTNLNTKIQQVREPPLSVNVVAAAGNNALEYVGYPASAPGVFAIGATDSTRSFWPNSNRGNALDVSTLGVGTCLTSAFGTRLAVGAGTSYAAPVVSAVLAALRSARPDLGPDEAEQLVLDHADITAAGKVVNAARTFYSAGVLTAEQAALSYAPNACEPVPVTKGPGAAASASGVSGSAPPAAPADTTAAPPRDVARVPVPALESGRSPDAQLPSTSVAKPRLRSVTFVDGLLTVKVGGCRDGWRAVFRVDERVRIGTGTRRRITTRTRSYTRTSGTLRVKVRTWTAVRVQLRGRASRHSETLTVRRSRDF
jgi:hypothetical protein